MKNVEMSRFPPERKEASGVSLLDLRREPSGRISAFVASSAAMYKLFKDLFDRRNLYSNKSVGDATRSTITETGVLGSPSTPSRDFEAAPASLHGSEAGPGTGAANDDQVAERDTNEATAPSCKCGRGAWTRTTKELNSYAGQYSERLDGIKKNVRKLEHDGNALERQISALEARIEDNERLVNEINLNIISSIRKTGSK